MSQQTTVLENEQIAPEPHPDATPAMRQYLSIKEAHRDYLLFYRMGDFYELFFDDAVNASRTLDIALTRRGKHAGSDIPMCGVPAHSYEPYLEKLIRAGHRVAICEQLEEPGDAKKRGYKAVIRRDVVRIITPGTVTEDNLLDAKAANYLACIARAGEEVALAWLDISTGEFMVTTLEWAELAAELARLSPKEILLADRLYEEKEAKGALKDWQDKLTLQPQSLFDSRRGERLLLQAYSVASLEAFGQFERVEVSACGALLDYVRLTQKATLPRLDPPKREQASNHLLIDPATRRNLELTQRLSGERQGSLLSVIDHTMTAPGARLLSQWLCAPLTNPHAINARLDAVHYFVEEEGMRQGLREILRECPDIERALSRLSVGRGGPRDLLAIRAGLEAARRIGAAFELQDLLRIPPSLGERRAELRGHDQLVDTLAAAIRPDCGILARDGEFILEKYSAPLDEFRYLRNEGKRLIATLQQRYADDTGIATLKIRHNNILGYYIEISAANQKRVPNDFIHRQTISGSLRYSTVELGELERKMNEAADRALKLELELFAELLEKVLNCQEAIIATARSLAMLDVAAGLAELAQVRHYVRPNVDGSLAFDIRQGRHPVVEVSLYQAGEPAFTGNDCSLEDAHHLWLLTGPNMAGKSTFLRQNALIAVLAQMGSFVPAASAHIGVVDRLFSRVGAADDLARGRSTFMVEMLETATILNQATGRSLVILDEIGRGTATYDGLSIAWAVVEYLHDIIRCRGLFATHYHELTLLAEQLASLSCHTMNVREWEGELIFLHEVIKGAADRSYGLHVAKLAGLPLAVVTRAGEVLAALEKERDERGEIGISASLPLFAHARVRETETPKPSALETELRTMNLDDLTPRQAQEALYRLRGMLE